MSYASGLKKVDPHQIASFSSVLTTHKQAAGDLATPSGSFDPRGNNSPSSQVVQGGPDMRGVGTGGRPRQPTTTSLEPGFENINADTGKPWNIQRTQGGSDVFDDQTGRQLPAGPHYEAYKTPSPHPNETPEQFRARNQQELQNEEAPTPSGATPGQMPDPNQIATFGTVFRPIKPFG